MKRLVTMGLLLLGALVLTAPAFAHGGGGYGMGPGMMGGDYGGSGIGPGMMGGGFGGMGPGMMGGGMGPLAMHPELAQLPPDKQEQLRKLHLSNQQTIIPKRADLQVKALALAETMRTFPIDRKAARAQLAAMDKVRGEMSELHLSMVTQVQQIVGKELWEQMHSPRPYGGMPGAGRGPAPGMTGPAMMGPQAPR